MSPRPRLPRDLPRALDKADQADQADEAAATAGHALLREVESASAIDPQLEANADDEGASA